eukprot:m.228252 g.228252  ORF g.228252 m.228252 type:complete len:672 (+) comp15190_c0_seq1:1427-3442(+)
MCDLFCSAGFMLGEDGCPVCKCNPDCSMVKCPAPECKPSKGCYYEKDPSDCCGCGKLVCEPKSTDSTPSMTPIVDPTPITPSPCNPVMCEMLCPFGFKLDEDGCEMCECNISCDTVRCMPLQCAPPPPGCRYQKSEYDCCSCGELVCDSTSSPSTDAECDPSTCMVPGCPAPPADCDYIQMTFDDCGCQLDCGKLECTSFTTPSPCDGLQCPDLSRCPKPEQPEKCEMKRGDVDECGCSSCPVYECEDDDKCRFGCPSIQCPYFSTEQHQRFLNRGCELVEPKPDECGCMFCPTWECPEEPSTESESPETKTSSDCDMPCPIPGCAPPPSEDCKVTFAEPDECGCVTCPSYECDDDEHEDVCEDDTCARDEICVSEPKQCFTTPCPQYKCEKKELCSQNPCEEDEICIPTRRVCGDPTKPCILYTCQSSNPSTAATSSMSSTQSSSPSTSASKSLSTSASATPELVTDVVTSDPIDTEVVQTSYTGSLEIGIDSTFDLELLKETIRRFIESTGVTVVRLNVYTVGLPQSANRRSAVSTVSYDAVVRGTEQQFMELDEVISSESLATTIAEEHSVVVTNLGASRTVDEKGSSTAIAISVVGGVIVVACIIAFAVMRQSGRKHVVVDPPMATTGPSEFVNPMYATTPMNDSVEYANPQMLVMDTGREEVEVEI